MKVVIADDEPLARERLRALLAEHGGVEIVAEAAGESMGDSAATQPVFMAHGASDPVIPLVHAERSAQALQSFGFEVEWHRYPMAHQVCAEEIRDLGDWMAQRFAHA